jgi:predicted nucleotidyltransferase
MIGYSMRKNNKIKKIIKEVVDKLQADYQPEKIILFGSYAYGQPKEDSDIDLFIIKDTDKRWVDRFVEVRRLIYDPKRGISVSPLIYTPSEIKERLSIGDDFVEDILAKGQVLYAR